MTQPPTPPSGENRNPWLQAAQDLAAPPPTSEPAPQPAPEPPRPNGRRTSPPLSSLPGFRGFTVSGQPAPIFGPVVPGVVPTPAQRPPATTRTRSVDLSGVDWRLVYRIRYTVAERLADAAGSDTDEATRVQIGRAMIPDIVKEHSDGAVLAADRANQISGHELPIYQRAVDSSIFGYGRWQPLLDDRDVENIEILGHDKVFMCYPDRIEPADPVADTDEELIEQLQFISTYSATPKPFSPAHPEMTLNLQDRFRLHAVAFDVVDRPTIVIRQHKFGGVPLDTLSEWGMMPTHLAGFLAAAVRARQSMVVSGIGGVGKTTFLRALYLAMDPMESVGVIETDAELFLHKIPGRGRVRNFVARQGTGEGFTPDGRPIGEYTVQDHLTASFRQYLQRIFVGEVRGSEAAAMFQAMQGGAGSLSTIHAQHAEATIERLVTAAALGGVMSQADAYRQIAVNLNLIIHIDAVDDRNRGGGYRRFVNEIIEIDGFRETTDGETLPEPATNVLYRASDPTRPLAEHMSHNLLQKLAREGWTP